MVMFFVLIVIVRDTKTHPRQTPSMANELSFQVPPTRRRRACSRYRMSNPSEQSWFSFSKSCTDFPISAACSATTSLFPSTVGVQVNWSAWVVISKVVWSFENPRRCSKITALESKTRIHLSFRVHLHLENVESPTKSLLRRKHEHVSTVQPSIALNTEHVPEVFTRRNQFSKTPQAALRHRTSGCLTRGTR